MKWFKTEECLPHSGVDVIGWFSVHAGINSTKLIPCRCWYDSEDEQWIGHNGLTSDLQHFSEPEYWSITDFPV